MLRTAPPTSRCRGILKVSAAGSPTPAGCAECSGAMESKDSDGDEFKEEKGCATSSKECESIITKVSKYFFDDPSFAGTFERWVEDKAPLIDLSLDEDEYQLKYTEIYEAFKELYEGMLEKYIVDEGSSVTDFYRELREATDRDPDGGEAMMGSIMLATTDFDIFMAMMRDQRKQLDTRSVHK